MADYVINIVHSNMYGRKTRPAQLTVQTGDTVKWKNKLERPLEGIHLTIKRGDEIFDGFPGDSKSKDGLPSYTLEIPPEGDSPDFRVVDNPPPGCHSYKVFCLHSEEYADGDSDPRIDIR